MTQPTQHASSTKVAPGSRRYYPLLDAIRGVAALMVVVWHGVPIFGAIFHKSYLAVDLFFALSGVVVANAYEGRLETSLSVPRFMLYRVARLYPLYFLSLLAAIAVVVIGHVAVGSPIAFVLATSLALFMLPLFAHLGPYYGAFFFPLNPPTWSLFYELLINFVYASTVRLISISALLIVMAISSLALCGVVIFARHHILDSGWTSNTFEIGLARVAFSYGAGLLLYRLRDRLSLPDRLRPPTLVFNCLLLSAVAMFLGVNPPVRFSGLYDLIAVIVAFPTIVYLAMNAQSGSASGRIFLFMGSVSYAVYVLHSPIFLGLEMALKHFHARLPISKLYAIPIVAVVVLISAFLDRMFDEPSRRRLNAWIRALPLPSLTGKRG